MLKRKENDATETVLKKKKIETESEGNSNKNISTPSTFEKKTKVSKKVPFKGNKSQKSANQKAIQEKPEDWNEFKKKKKELKLKRKQQRTGFDAIVKAKQIGEKLRYKNLKGGEVERNKLINELHSMLKEEGHYAKFVLAHDTSRIVQWLLKYSSAIVKEQISKDLIPVTLDMLSSKYAIFCVKRLLKYGSQETKSEIVKAMYGNAVRLASHALSAPVFELAYSTCASSLQKQHLLQEFFGNIYKNSKDDKIKHLRDVYEQSPSLKSATLSSTKLNLQGILNKNLLDSTLVQTVFNQYLSECSNDDKMELIEQLIPHIVIISNSKDGVRAAMKCVWHGTNKDKKNIMKQVKEHVIELAKHESAYYLVISLLDTVDDTVLLHKVIISKLLTSAQDLAGNEWGRKVLLWLVAPADSTCFHPSFIKELEEGKKHSTSKKETEIRRKEILDYSIDALLNLVTEDPQFWLKNSSLAYEMLAILKAGRGDSVKKAFSSILKVITSPEWKVKVNEKEIFGIEDTGLHMVLKKLAKHDKDLDENEVTFGSCLTEALTDDVINNWLTLNRGCFLLIAVYENGSSETQEALKQKLKTHLKLLKKQSSAGSKILYKNVSE